MRGLAALEHDTSFAKAPGRAVTLFLADGRPDGIVTASMGNWNGQVLAAPRSRVPGLLERPEARRTGIYILLAHGAGNRHHDAWQDEERAVAARVSRIPASLMQRLLPARGLLPYS